MLKFLENTYLEFSWLTSHGNKYKARCKSSKFISYLLKHIVALAQNNF